jgi:apolipoprotein D and lipocalin family protein
MVSRAIVCGLALFAFPQGAPPREAAGLDPKLLAGTYYEIARIPNSFERQCVGEVTTTYDVRPDGRLDVFNECRNENGTETRAHGIGRPAADGATIEVRFPAPWLSGGRRPWPDYAILGAGPEYSYVVAGDAGRHHLWILSRLPRMSQLAYAQAIEIAKGRGHDVARLVRTPEE